MEQIEHYFRLRTVLADLGVKGGIHIHSDRFNLLTALAQLLEERADRLAAVAFTHPEYPGTFGIHDHGGIPMPLLKRKLIHDQASNITRIKATHRGLQTPFIKRLDRMPMQPRELADVTDRQQ